MAIRGVSLDVESGTIVTILGANGAGKTTVLKTISGAMDPQKGSVVFADENITSWDLDRVARLGVGHVPEGREVFPFLSVEENLRMGAFTRRDGQSPIRRDLDLVYDYFPTLGDNKSLAAGYLSGGQQQMLAIGRALMLRPRLMLLDEPSLGLAPLIIEDLFERFTTLNKETGLTMLVVEQNANLALEMADFGYVIESGEIALSGTADELKNDPAVQEAYLGA